MRVGVRVLRAFCSFWSLNSSPAVGCLQFNMADVGISSRQSPSLQEEEA